MRLRVLVIAILAGVPLSRLARGSEPHFEAVPTVGQAAFRAADDEASLPVPFRMADHQFEFRADPDRAYSAVRTYRVRFPSPVESPEAQNNTVHAKYFQPERSAAGPGVVVLHILGGDFLLSETIALHLARNGVAALFVKMPYYGERRIPGGRRMISNDPRISVAGMRQAVLDIRRAAAWMAARPEVDERRLGITGISLGGIMSALAAGVESRLSSCAIYLGGGDFADILWDLPLGEAAEFRKAWLEAGETQDSFREILKHVDPVTYAPRLRGRRILMVNALQDEVIPRASTDALFHAMDRRADLVWLDAGHYTAARFLPFEMVRLQLFFQGRLKPALLLSLATSTGEIPAGSTPTVMAILTNVGTEPLKLVLPPDGDPQRCFEWLARKPGAEILTEEDDAQEIPPGGTATLLEAGNSLSLKIPPPSALDQPGRYILSLRYRCTLRSWGGASSSGIRETRIESNPLEIRVGAQSP